LALVGRWWALVAPVVLALCFVEQRDESGLALLAAVVVGALSAVGVVVGVALRKLASEFDARGRFRERWPRGHVAYRFAAR
jgi:hypothetical protein